jgi:hypothetical protein
VSAVTVRPGPAPRAPAGRCCHGDRDLPVTVDSGRCGAEVTVTAGDVCLPVPGPAGGALPADSPPADSDGHGPGESVWHSLRIGIWAGHGL